MASLRLGESNIYLGIPTQLPKSLKNKTEVNISANSVLADGIYIEQHRRVVHVDFTHDIAVFMDQLLGAHIAGQFGHFV